MTVMNLYGILFGLFIIGCGLYGIFLARDKDDDKLIIMGHGVLWEVRYVKLFGKIVVLIGSFFLILALLLP
jgi:hypothetical protein